MAFATALALTSLAVGAYSSYQTYRGQKEQARTATNVSEFNAQLAEQEALQADMVTRENLRRKRLADKRTISRQRARFGASGVRVDEGSPLEVMAESAAMLEQEALDIDREGRLQSQQATSRAAGTRLEGASISSGFKKQAKGTILSGVTDLLGGGYSFIRQGAI